MNNSTCNVDKTRNKLICFVTNLMQTRLEIEIVVALWEFWKIGNFWDSRKLDWPRFLRFFAGVAERRWAIGFLIVIMDISLPNQAMVLNWVDLGEKISQVFDTRTPENLELAIFDSILDPVISHGCWLKSTNPDGFIRSRWRCVIVDPDPVETKVCQDILENACSLRIEE